MGTLGTVGIADKGVYNPSTTYVIGNSVYYGGSTWVAQKDNLTGIIPQEGENWKYLARGFGSDNLSQIEAKDTSGVLGTAGGNVVSQDLIDAIADKVMTKLFPSANVVNNGLTTQAGFALDARYGKTLKDLIDTANSNLSALSAASMKYQYFSGTVAAGVANGSVGFVSAEMVKPDGYKLAGISCTISSVLGTYAIYTRLNGIQLRAGFLNYTGSTTTDIVTVYAVAIYVPS